MNRRPLLKSASDVGGAAFDVDGEGWLDFSTGGAWYRNCGKPRTEPFERIVTRAALTLVGASSAVNGRACRRRKAVGRDWSAAPANVQAAT